MMIGFTNGIALLIASTQIKDFLGLKTGEAPSAFLPRMRILFEHIEPISWQACAVSVVSLAITILWPTCYCFAEHAINRRNYCIAPTSSITSGVTMSCLTLMRPCSGRAKSIRHLVGWVRRWRATSSKPASRPGR